MTKKGEINLSTTKVKWTNLSNVLGWSYFFKTWRDTFLKTTVSQLGKVVGKGLDSLSLLFVSLRRVEQGWHELRVSE